MMSEAGCALGQVGDFERKIDAVLGSALWAIDWVLLATRMGISRVNMNQCNGCIFAGFLAASDTGPEVFAWYYWLVFLADWLGLSDTTQNGSFKVLPLYDGSKYPNISPYAACVEGKLDRLAVLDLNE